MQCIICGSKPNGLNYKVNLCNKCGENVKNSNNYFYFPQNDMRVLKIKKRFIFNKRQYCHEDELLFKLDDRCYGSIIKKRHGDRIDELKKKGKLFDNIIDQVLIQITKYDIKVNFAKHNTSIGQKYKNFTSKIQYIIEKRMFYNSVSSLSDLSYWVNIICEDIIKFKRGEQIIKTVTETFLKRVSIYCSNSDNIINLPCIKPLCDKYIETGDEKYMKNILDELKPIQEWLNASETLKKNFLKYGIRYTSSFRFK